MLTVVKRRIKIPFDIAVWYSWLLTITFGR